MTRRAAIIVLDGLGIGAAADADRYGDVGSNTLGNVSRAVRGLRLPTELSRLPQKGDKLFHEGKEVGYVTSSCRSHTLQLSVALGYIRREHNAAGTELLLGAANSTSKAVVCDLPFVAPDAV